MFRSLSVVCRFVLATLCAAALIPRSAGADLIKIGVLKVTGAAPVFIAQEKGYFAKEGVPAELVYFDASQPIAVAVTSGAIDFGITGFTAGFYSLAGQGALRVIGGGYAREAPGFHNQGYVASNQAYCCGPEISAGLSQPLACHDADRLATALRARAPDGEIRARCEVDPHSPVAGGLEHELSRERRSGGCRDHDGGRDPTAGVEGRCETLGVGRRRNAVGVRRGFHRDQDRE